MELVSLGGHDEIVPMQTFDFMRPPCDRYLPPLSQYGGVMSFRLGKLPNLVREYQGLVKIPEFEMAL
jgi:hypothetical protein